MNLARIAPWVAGAVALGSAVVAVIPPGRADGFDVDAFGRLPVLDGGRVKPVDSVARNSLLMIRGQQSFRDVDASGRRRTVTAELWLLDVLFRPEEADQQRIFVINDPEVLGLIGLRQTSERYFSFATLAPHLQELEKQGQAAQMVDARQRTRFQGAVANLYERILLYYRLKNTVQLEGVAPLVAELGARTDAMAPRRHDALIQLAAFRPLPPPPGAPAEAWRSAGEALRDAGAGQPDAALVALARVAAGWSGRDPATFDAAVAELRGLGFIRSPDAISQADHEIVFNRVQPFYLGMIIYVAALLLVFAGWLWRPQVLQPTALALLGAGAVVHTLGLASRVILQGRPPVTNLYSSAVFVGWGAVLLGIVLERMYRKGFGTAVAAASGFASLIVAHHLTGDGDTMEMMRAVLDSNFWLATHVVTITIGYSGTFLAGAIAIGWAFWRQLARAQDPETGRTLVAMAYGVVCFALFFSFIGTVLGGIWADQSWGRFWGWDPKENGALLIVLWNAIILHARWGGYARDRGIMAMAIFGNVITALSWFGVNMLGVGLHSYGFMDKAFWALSGFCGSQLLLMGLALAPPRFWRGAAGAAEARGGAAAG